MHPAYDLLIKGGTLIDPAQGIHANKDVAFAGGVVAAVADDIPATAARQAKARAPDRHQGRKGLPKR